MKLLFALLPALLLLNPAKAADRIRLAQEHLDLAVILEPSGTNLLDIQLHDEDNSRQIQPEDAVLVVPEAARTRIPEGFEELGPMGSELWILPAHAEPGRLLLGMSGEALEGIVPPQRVDLFLRRLDGPGHFLAWRTDGGLLLSVTSRDGLGPADRFAPAVGGHEDHNYGFTTNGLYTLWFQARATVGGTNAWSPEVPVQFAVEPLPAVVAEPAVLAASGLEPDGSLRLLLIGTPGASYTIEGTANLRTWEPIGEVTASQNPQAVLLPMPAQSPPRFFRAIAP